MVNLVKTNTRGPKPGYTRDEPYHPERVIKVIERALTGITYVELAREFGITPAGASHIVRRWKKWYLAQRSE